MRVLVSPVFLQALDDEVGRKEGRNEGTLISLNTETDEDTKICLQSESIRVKVYLFSDLFSSESGESKSSCEPALILPAKGRKRN